MADFEGVPDGHGRRLAVLVSRFNEGITQRLERGAVDALLRAGVAEADLDLIRGSMRDIVIEPQRSHLIPGFAKLQAEAHVGVVTPCGLEVDDAIHAVETFEGRIAGEGVPRMRGDGRAPVEAGLTAPDADVMAVFQ